LYLFYWGSLGSRKNGIPSNSKNIKALSGFGFVWLNFVFQFMVVFIATTMYFDVLDSAYDFFLNIWGRTETHKGTVNVAFLISLSIASACATYLVCCFRINAETAVVRLAKTNFFNSPSYWKIYAPFVLTYVCFSLLLSN
jgi:hypothetical protein